MKIHSLFFEIHPLFFEIHSLFFENSFIENPLTHIQKAGVPVEFNEFSDLPIPDLQAVLFDKIKHLETNNCNLRSTFNDIYNKYMQSENEKHALEEKVEEQNETIKQMETQIAQLEQQMTSNQSQGSLGNVETILKDQRDRYKRRIDELEVSGLD